MTEPNHLSFPSPLGTLTIFSDGAALIALETGRAPDDGNPDRLLIEAKTQLDAYFDGRLTTFDLPLAPHGPKRRQEIWAAMCDVGYGKTETYGEFAARIQSAPRAIGGACAANPLPIFIPCHRILGAGNTLAGYSFADGRDTKRQLLTLEGIHLAV
jgi:methylated-DNA-[protein]-cysteine S-methyltransferase